MVEKGLGTFIGNKKTYKALPYFSRSLMELYNENTKNRWKILDDQPNVIKVVFRDYNSKDIDVEQGGFCDFMFDLIGLNILNIVTVRI